MVHVELWLYGPLARYAGETAQPGYACLKLALPDGARVRDLLAHLSLPLAEKGITFINGQLTDMPGLAADLDQELSEGDRIAIFHERSMWPFQYRHGAKLSPALQKAMAESEGGAMRHATGSSSPRSGR